MKSLLACALSVCFFCAGSARGARGFDFKAQVGVVDTNEQKELCLNILNAGLAGGSRVSVVVPGRPQSVIRAVVLRKLGRNCSRTSDVDPAASFYSLRPLAGGVKAAELAGPLPPSIAVVASARPIRVVRGTASADLDGDGRREYFRRCTSNEGFHLTVWSGRPLAGRRRWHAYYYLEYDVVPSCDERDFQS